MDTPEKIIKDLTEIYLHENGGRPLSFWKRMKLKKDIRDALRKNFTEEMRNENEVL